MTNDRQENAGGLSRRELIRRLVNGAGAGVLFTRTAMAHPIYKYLADGELVTHAEAQVPVADWTPKYLNAWQNETLVQLAERLVPNSSQAQVNRFIDLLLSVDNAENQLDFNDSLAAFDQASKYRFGQAFKDVSAAQQDELLTIFSAQAPSRKPGDESSNDDAPSKSHATDRPNQRDHFENLKTWVTGAYYSSEIGMRELGWTGVSFFQELPGCQHTQGHS